MLICIRDASGATLMTPRDVLCDAVCDCCLVHDDDDEGGGGGCCCDCVVHDVAAVAVVVAVTVAVVVDAVGIVRGCLPLRFFVCVVFAAEPMRRGRWSTLHRQSFAAEDKASPADNSPTECQS